MKPRIEFILWVNGSCLYLGELLIDKSLQNRLESLECDNPKKLKEVLRYAVDTIDTMTDPDIEH